MKRLVTILAVALTTIQSFAQQYPSRLNTLIQYEQDQRKKEREFLRWQLEHPSQQVTGSGGFTVLGRWAWGPSRGVQIVGNYALLIQSFVYQVFDISNPFSPTVVYDTTLASNLYQIKKQGDYLFIAVGDGVLICDGSQLFPLVQLGKVQDPGGATDFAVSDTLIYLIADWGDVRVHSIANPAQPRFLAHGGESDEFGVASIAAKGCVAYFGALGVAYSSLQILEYVPDSIQMRQRFFNVGGQSAWSLHVEDTLLYTGNGRGDVRVHSITDPFNPVSLGSVRLSTQPVTALAASGNRLFASDTGLAVIDVANPALPRVLSRSERNSSRLSASANIVAGTQRPGMTLYRRTTPDSVAQTYFFPTPLEPSGITLRGQVGYVFTSDAVWAVDFSHPARPTVLARHALEGFGPVARSGDLACFPCGQNTNAPDLCIVRLTENGGLTLLSRTIFPSQIWSIEARDTLLFLAASDSLLIYSIADPQVPNRLGKWSSGVNFFNGSDLSANGNYLFVAAGGDSGGLKTLNISNPRNPLLESSIFRHAQGVFSVDTLAYVFTDTPFVPSFLASISIANPAAPRVLGTLRSPTSNELVRRGNCLYSVNYRDGLRAYDVSVPSLLQIADSVNFEILYSSLGLDVVNDTILVATLLEGVTAFKYAGTTNVFELNTIIPVALHLSQNYPNPFNGQTTIAFALPFSDEIVLDLFDVLGRKLKTLAYGLFGSGLHKLFLNADELPSGVYFYYLTTKKGGTLARKALLLR